MQKQKGNLRAFLIRDGQKIGLGEFNRNHKKSQELIESQGLEGKRLKVKLKSKISTLDLAIDPDSIVYPDSSIERFSASSQMSLATEKNPTTSNLLERAALKSSVLHFRDRVWQTPSLRQVIVGSVDLVVDADVSDEAASLLKEYGFEELSKNDPSIATESSKGFAVFTVPEYVLSQSQLLNLKDIFKVDKTFDVTRNGLVATDKFKQHFTKQYSDVALVDSSDVAQEFPQLTEERIQAANAEIVPSQRILTLLSQANPPREIYGQLDRYDYGWLNSSIDSDDVLAGSSEVKQYLDKSENRDALANKVRSYLLKDEALVYQHLIAGTNARFEGDLKLLLGDKYAPTIAKVRGLIAEGIVPVRVMDDSIARAIPALMVNRES